MSMGESAYDRINDYGAVKIGASRRSPGAGRADARWQRITPQAGASCVDRKPEEHPMMDEIRLEPVPEKMPMPAPAHRPASSATRRKSKSRF